MHWDTVIQHCQIAPQDAAFQDGHWHETPLYLAMQFNPPFEAVRAIVDAYPKGVTQSCGENHDLPLHIACKNQASSEILEVLLEEYPSSALRETKWGNKIPLVTLWESSQPVDSCFWRKVEIILRAVDRHRKENNQETVEKSQSQSIAFQADSLLHAAVSLGSLGCPFEIFEFFVSKYPSEVSKKDSLGLYPLNIIVGPTSWSSTSRRKYKPREKEFISLLLERCPRIASERLGTDQDRYPLHSALINRHTWFGGIKELFFAAPSVLLEADPVTKLYPFQLAAIPIRDTQVDLDTIFHLLREQPAVLSRFDCESGAHNRDLNHQKQCLSSIRDKQDSTAGFLEEGLRKNVVSPYFVLGALSIGAIGVAGTYWKSSPVPP